MSALDPDIVFSFRQLDPSLRERILKRLVPFEIIEVTPDEAARSEGRHLINGFRLRQLGVEDIPQFRLSAPDIERNPLFFNITLPWQDSPDRRFILRNFGARTATMTTRDMYEPVPHATIETTEFLMTPVFDRLCAEARRAIVPLDFCRLYASRNYYPDFDTFTHGFHLVVGDTVDDALYAWNRELIAEGSAGRDTFWLPSALSTDDAFLNRLAEWMRYTFWGHDFDRRGTVVSYSVDEGDLRRIAQAMAPRVHFHFNTARLHPGQFPSPQLSPLPFRPKRVAQVSLSEKRGLVEFPRPPFLLRGHPQMGWMIDLQIQHRPESYQHTNLRPSWDLPRKLGLAHSFFDPFRDSRIVVGGLPSARVETAESVIGVKIPEDREIVYRFFEQPWEGRRRAPASAVRKFIRFETSDKGMYLEGMIRLFGSLFDAGNTLEDPFWRDVIVSMAGAGVEAHEGPKDAITTVFCESFAEDRSPIALESPRLELIAERVARRLIRLPRPNRPLTLKNLRDRFAGLRGRARAAGGDHAWWGGDSFREDKQPELVNLLRSGVFLQGANLRCSHCTSRLWYEVGALTTDIRCRGCASAFSLPPDPEWSFTLNDLVGNCLRLHGSLAVLQALYLIQRDTRGMFMYLPCQDIFGSGTREPYTDLDLVLICDGRFIIGEVKSDPAGYLSADLTKIQDVAIELAPDAVILAAMGGAWPREVENKFGDLERALAPGEIQVVPRLLEWR